MADSWDMADDALRQILSTDRGRNISPETLSNALDFIAFARSVSSPATPSLGYWPTLCFSWAETPGPHELEVFDDHFELYWLDQGQSEIRHYQHLPGEPMPTAFVHDFMKGGRR